MNMGHNTVICYVQLSNFNNYVLWPSNWNCIQLACSWSWFYYIQDSRMDFNAKMWNSINSLKVTYCTTPHCLVPCCTILSYTRPYQTIPHHTLWYHVVPYCPIPYQTIPYHMVLYQTIPNHAILHHTVWYHAVPYCPIPYQTIPDHPAPYHTIPHHTILHHTIPYHTTPYHPIIANTSGRETFELYWIVVKVVVKITYVCTVHTAAANLQLNSWQSFTLDHSAFSMYQQSAINYDRLMKVFGGTSSPNMPTVVHAWYVCGIGQMLSI
jgi:hypothetical protein